MKKVILLESVLVSMLLADGVGVREAIKQQGYRIGAIGETKTQMEYEHLGVPSNGTNVIEICKAIGGDNLYALRGKEEVPYFVNGDRNPEAGFGLKGLFVEDVFSGEKNTP